MRLFLRRLAPLAVSVALAIVLASCADRTVAPTAASIQIGGPSMGYAPPAVCSAPFVCVPCTDPTACGVPSNGVPHTEQLQVCKVYPAGTLNPPAVQIALHVSTLNAPLGPEDLTFTLQPNSCLLLWRNGEMDGNYTDTMHVSETVPPGYTGTSQVTTIVRVGPRQDNPADNVFTTSVGATTKKVTDITGIVGGPQIPGLTITFTNTLIPAPSCTFTQGYWKNHEPVWPAPYSATAQWLNGSHVVNGVTWDGLMGMSVAGGNSYMQLAHQWIAAKLNLGSALSSGNATVDAALSAGGAWLLSKTPASTTTVPNIKNAQATAWAGTLDSYNNGLMGTPHCQ